MKTTEGYIEKNISFQNRDINLEGTLTLLKNVREHSAVLLLPGSGLTYFDNRILNNITN